MTWNSPVSRALGPVALAQSAGTSQTGGQRSGLLSTVCNLLFAGDSANNFVAFDAACGVPLWRAGLHASITNGPITYQLDGFQYVVVAANDALYGFASRGQ